MEIDNVLRAIYYDRKNPSGLSSIKKLYEAAKDILPDITINDVKKWLSGEFTYTLHKQARRYIDRDPIVVEEPNQQVEADLVDMQEFSRVNKGYKFLLTYIDVMTKYAYVVALKNKNAKSVLAAFKTIFNKVTIPRYLRTDKGTEFLNKYLQKYLKENNVIHFTSNNQTIKCAIVERFNRTLKGKMFKYFTAKGTRIWYNIVQDLVIAYNNSYHRTIKMTPLEATNTDASILFKNIYNVKDWNELYKRNKKPKLNIGDTVREKYDLNVFDKSYYPNWKEKIETIESISKEPKKPLYKIGQKRRFYEEELQKVTENLYRVEKVLKSQIINGNKQYYIKWLGYPDRFNSWVDSKDLKKL